MKRKKEKSNTYQLFISTTEGPRLTRILGLGKNRVTYMKFVLVGL